MSLAYDLAKWQAEREADPLSEFSFTHAGRVHTSQRQLVEHVVQGHETALEGGNQSGKTIGGAALVVALAQGRQRLGDVALPAIGQPSVWWVLTQTYKQQVESTQSAIERWLGTWPHVIRTVPGVAEAAQLILVKPLHVKSDDPKKWSRIWFHVQQTGQTLPGGRVDGVWADEPPDVDCWAEATARGRGPGKPFLLWITYTPIKRREWEPLRERFKACDNQVVQGRIRLRATVFDNPWLTPDYLESLKNLWRDRWDTDARLYGAEVDDTGRCPFTSTAELAKAMGLWQSRCRLPVRVPYQVLSETGWNGSAKVPKTVEVERYHPFEVAETYYGLVDPSLGIPDAQHDPGALHVYSMMRPRLVERWTGYLDPYALGWLAGKVMKGRASDQLDIEMNDNLGIQVMRGARDAGHDNFAGDVREDKISGTMENVLGWKTTATNRGGFIAAVLQLLGEDSVLIESQGVIDTLRGIVVNPQGRTEAGYRKHDEDMILLGRFGYISRMGSAVDRTPARTPERTRLMELLGARSVATPSEVDNDEWWRSE